MQKNELRLFNPNYSTRKGKVYTAVSTGNITIKDFINIEFEENPINRIEGIHTKAIYSKTIIGFLTTGIEEFISIYVRTSEFDDSLKEKLNNIITSSNNENEIVRKVIKNLPVLDLNGRQRKYDLKTFINCEQGSEVKIPSDEEHEMVSAYDNNNFFNSSFNLYNKGGKFNKFGFNDLSDNKKTELLNTKINIVLYISEDLDFKEDVYVMDRLFNGLNNCEKVHSSLKNEHDVDYDLRKLKSKIANNKMFKKCFKCGRNSIMTVSTYMFGTYVNLFKMDNDNYEIMQETVASVTKKSFNDLILSTPEGKKSFEDFYEQLVRYIDFIEKNNIDLTYATTRLDNVIKNKKLATNDEFKRIIGKFNKDIIFAYLVYYIGDKIKTTDDIDNFVDRLIIRLDKIQDVIGSNPSKSNVFLFDFYYDSTKPPKVLYYQLKNETLAKARNNIIIFENAMHDLPFRERKQNNTI